MACDAGIKETPPERRGFTNNKKNKLLFFCTAHRAFTVVLGQVTFTDTDRGRSDFYQFVVIDELQSLLGVILTGGTRTVASSVPDARMLVSFLPVRQFTVRSLERL